MGDVVAVAAHDVLRRRPWKSGLSNEGQEASLQDRLTTAVDEQLVEDTYATLPAATKLGEPIGEDQRCRQTQTQRAVDRRSQTWARE